MSSGGFWPGEPPAVEQEDVEEPEATAAEPPGWPQQPAEEPETEPEGEQAAADEASVDESEPDEEEAEIEDEAEGAVVGHVPGELDIPDGVAILEGSPSGADRTVGVV